MSGETSGKFSYKVFKHEGEVLIAICDAELLGRRFEENDLRLFVDEKFYCERFCEENEARELLGQATMLNLTGNKIINIAVAEGFVDKERILFIKEIPHAQCARIE